MKTLYRATSIETFPGVTVTNVRGPRVPMVCEKCGGAVSRPGVKRWKVVLMNLAWAVVVLMCLAALGK